MGVFLMLKESYCEVLHTYKEELSKPFDEATIFLSNIESQLSNLCIDAPTAFRSGHCISGNVYFFSLFWGAVLLFRYPLLALKYWVLSPLMGHVGAVHEMTCMVCRESLSVLGVSRKFNIFSFTWIIQQMHSRNPYYIIGVPLMLCFLYGSCCWPHPCYMCHFATEYLSQT